MDEIVGWVNRSYADFVILGGDFNTSPKDNVSFIPKINLRITIIIITTITKGSFQPESDGLNMSFFSESLCSLLLAV